MRKLFLMFMVATLMALMTAASAMPAFALQKGPSKPPIKTPMQCYDVCISDSDANLSSMDLGNDQFCAQSCGVEPAPPPDPPQ